MVAAEFIAHPFHSTLFAAGGALAVAAFAQSDRRKENQQLSNDIREARDAAAQQPELTIPEEQDA